MSEQYLEPQPITNIIPNDDPKDIERGTRKALALSLLEKSDHKVGKAFETKAKLKPEFIAWREGLREIVRGNSDAEPTEFGGE